MAYSSLKIFFLVAFSVNTYAASCCGGGGGSSSVVTSENRAKVYLSYRNAAYVYDVDTLGNASKRTTDEEEVLESMNIGGAYIFDNYFQLAMSTSVNKVTKRTSSKEESTSDISDSKISIAYEFLQEKYYSRWKPRGFIYFSQLVPTGNSRYDAEKPLQTDITGGGFHKSQVGLTLFKVIDNFDVTVDLNSAYYHSESFNDVSVYRFPSTEFSISAGVSPGYSPVRVGLSYSYKYDGHSELEFTDGRINHSKGSRVSTIGLGVNYLAGDISYGVNYFDQTLLAGSRNSSLEKSLLLNISKAFPL